MSLVRTGFTSRRWQWTGIWWLLAAGVLVAAVLHATPAHADAGQGAVRLGNGTLVFASVEQAREALVQDDIWLRTTSAFQRAATMRNAASTTVEQFRGFLATTALPWNAADVTRWRQALDALAPTLAALPLQWPQQILLVQTDGRDASGAPYTRGNAIFLPRGLQLADYTEAELLAHELFHVLTRHQPALAERLYAELGFEPAAELDWPAEWMAARIANPDAPYHRHIMRTDVRGQTQAVMPLLVARRTQLQPGETFFDVLDVRLLAVRPGGNAAPTHPLRGTDGQLIWLPVAEAPAYLQRLGGNTDYVFHPEETAADNFAFLLSGRRVPNPGLLTRFEQVLRQTR